MSVDRAVLLARAYLSRVAEPPAPGVGALVDQVGPVRAAAMVRAGTVDARAAAETAARRTLPDTAAADLDAITALGGTLLVPEDPLWPHDAFAALHPDVIADRRLRAPVALWVRGPARLDRVQARAVAVVGARAATAYGEHVAADLAHGLASRGVVVVSGAAYGIDAAAHRGALAAEGVTIAVLACGVDRVYPAGNAGLVRRLLDRGAVISEYPPGTRPARSRFLVRNRLIAALCAGTVVVEAGLRSGARRTAGLADAAGRIVMAVPGPVTSSLSVGCHQLVRDNNAILVTTAQDVLESVGPLGAAADVVLTGEQRPTDGLSVDELAVHDALPARAARDPEQLSRESGVAVDRVRALLPLLEIRGLVGHGPHGWYRTAA